MSFPQLRVRTGFSFRHAYGHIPDVAKYLKEIECPYAAIVDSSGTYGHVKFTKAMQKEKLPHGFGMEISVISDGSERKPKAWILAKETKAFYNITSEAVQNGGLNADRFSTMSGVVRFAGSALSNPDHFDFIDINSHSLLATAQSIKLAKETGKKIVITSDNLMPRESDRRYAAAHDCRLGVTPEHILTEDEVCAHFGRFFPKADVSKWIDNTLSVVDLVKGAKLHKAPIITAEGNLLQSCREGVQYRLERGHIAEWTQEYEDRLNEELYQIQLKEFESYFIIVADLVQYAKSKMMVGPSRGSSAGSLVCYLLRITEVDPIPHDLMFFRFIDISRGGFIFNGGFKKFGEV